MNLADFLEYISDKKVMCFGTGIQGERMIDLFHGWNLDKHIVAYIDNNPDKVGTYTVGKTSYPIISFDEACQQVDTNTFVLITSIYYPEIYEQIKGNSISREWDCMAFDEIAEAQLFVSDYLAVVKESKQPLIPKKIHYAWFGDEMPEKMKGNIENWKKLCPGYEFYEWNDKNYDISTNAYMKQAYDRKVWGFVPDYMRLDIIYKYGGIYLDTDIEMVKSPDELLYQKCFGCVDASLVMNLGSGFGAAPGTEIIRELRDYYDNVSFVKKDGRLDKTSCNSHSHKVLSQYGVKINDTLQNIYGMNIYPMIFQGACQHTRTTRVTDKTFWIHHGNMSWL